MLIAHLASRHAHEIIQTLTYTYHLRSGRTTNIYDYHV